MENEAPVTPSNNLNDLSKDTPITANVEARDDSIGRDQNITGDGIDGDHIPGDQIIVDIGAGAQNVVVGSGNTQIIGYTAEQVAVIITQIRRADQPQGWNGRIPYIGLDSFGEQQAHLFFGREKLVTHLLSRVQESRFLCITGPSGSGKSSLMQAGLIPALRAGQLAGSEQWLFETVRPGNQPLENFALAIGRMAKSPLAAEYFRTHSATDPLTLHTQMETLLSHQLNQRAVIVVDQFEEIFTQTKDEALRLTFLALLTHAVQRADGRVSVLLTMRSDFVSQCASYASLRQLISGQLELVGAMTPEELARAIAMPALEVGVEVKPALVAQVINDMQGEPGALPLLQFALKDLFDAQPKQPGRPVVLLLQEYLLRGGLHQALERHANAQFDQFLPEEQGIARQIFMRLIEVGRGTVDTRRTAVFSELLPLSVDTNQVERIVQTLANARLLTTDNPHPEQVTPSPGDTRIVTIAHEKLIEAWPWLQQLVRENRTLIELQNQISADAVEWNEHQRDASYLYVGARLQTAQEQLATNQLTLSALAQALIDSSVHAEAKRQQQLEDERQRELAHQRALAQEQKLRAEAERQRAEEQTQAAQRLRRRNQWLGLALAGALLLTVIALLFFQQARTAQQTADQKAQEAQAAVTAQAIEVINRRDAQATAEAERATAQRNATIALSRQFAAQSMSELGNHHYESAILLAIESGRVTDTLEAFDAIRAAIASPWHSRTVFYGHTKGVDSAVWNQAETKILTSSDDATARVWDATNGQELVKLTDPTMFSVDSAVWNQAETNILTSSADGAIRIWNATTGQEVLKLTGHRDRVNSAVWSQDETKVLTSSADATARIWNASTGQEVLKLTGHSGIVYSAVWSHDESKILTHGIDATARIWDAATGQELVKLTGHKDTINSVLWSKDESKILTSSADGAIRIWNATTGQAVLTLTSPSESALYSAAWSQDESKILAINSDHTVQIWDATTGQELVKLSGHTDSIGSALWSQDESKILTSSSDNTVRIWDAASGQALSILQGHTNRVNSAVWNQAENKILTSSADGSVRIWDTTTGQELLKRTGPPASTIYSSVWSQDASKLLTITADHTLQIWDAATGQAVAKLSGETDTVYSAVWSPDDRKLLTKSEAGPVQIWDAVTGQALSILQGHTDRVNSALWSQDASKILTSSADNTVRVWDTTTGQELLKLTASPEGRIFSPVWSQDESKILTSNGDNTAQIWDAATGQAVVKLSGETSIIRLAVWSPADRKLLTSSANGITRVWDAVTGQALVEFMGYSGLVYSAAWSQDESKILISSINGAARVWDVITGQVLVELTAPPQSTIYSVMWNQDESKILTGSTAGAARIWDAVTGQPLVEFIGHSGLVHLAAWSQDESKILTLSGDNTVQHWYVHMDDLLSAACTWAPRNLTQREWEAYREGRYVPTCPHAPIPPDAISAIEAEAGEQIRAGQVISATQRLEQLNQWLQLNGQFKTFGIDVPAQIAEISATATAPPPTVMPAPNATPTPPQLTSPLRAQLPSPLATPIITPTPNDPSTRP